MPGVLSTVACRLSLSRFVRRVLVTLIAGSLGNIVTGFSGISGALFTTRVRDGVGVISAIEGRILGSRGAYGAVHHSVRICAVKSETARVLTVLPTERICSGFPGPIIYLHNGGPIRPIGLGSRNLDTVLVDMDPAIVARPIHPLPGIGVRVSVPILLHGVLIAPYSFSLLPFVRLSLSSIAALGRARAIATPIIGLEVQL